MNPDEDTVLTVADIVLDSTAMNDAALADDFDEARFRAQLIATKADSAGLDSVAIAAAYVLERLGPLGSRPRDGYGAGMLRIASELDRVGFTPL